MNLSYEVYEIMMNKEQVKCFLVLWKQWIDWRVKPEHWTEIKIHFCQDICICVFEDVSFTFWQLQRPLHWYCPECECLVSEWWHQYCNFIAATSVCSATHFFLYGFNFKCYTGSLTSWGINFVSICFVLPGIYDFS